MIRKLLGWVIGAALLVGLVTVILDALQSAPSPVLASTIPGDFSACDANIKEPFGAISDRCLPLFNEDLPAALLGKDCPKEIENLAPITAAKITDTYNALQRRLKAASPGQPPLKSLYELTHGCIGKNEVPQDQDAK